MPKKFRIVIKPHGRVTVPDAGGSLDMTEDGRRKLQIVYKVLCLATCRLTSTQI